MKKVLLSLSVLMISTVALAEDEKPQCPDLQGEYSCIQEKTKSGKMTRESLAIYHSVKNGVDVFDISDIDERFEVKYSALPAIPEDSSNESKQIVTCVDRQALVREYTGSNIAFVKTRLKDGSIGMQSVNTATITALSYTRLKNGDLKVTSSEADISMADMAIHSTRSSSYCKKVSNEPKTELGHAVE